MTRKPTNELEHILKKTKPDNIEQFLKDHADSFIVPNKPFSEFVHQILKKKGLTQQEVFIRADIPERYGYKLLSEEKRTKQRDYILRICYAANMTLEETQTALTLYGMAQLYARIPRDAVLMIAFNQRKGDIISINVLLADHEMEPLRTSGNIE